VVSSRNRWGSPLPLYVCDVVGLDAGGRDLEILIVMLDEKRGIMMGVFLELDLLTQDYVELRWVKSRSHDDIPRGNRMALLSEWGESLSLSRRMRQLMVGPYSVDPVHPISWTALCEDGMTDADKSTDFDPRVWGSFLDAEERGKAEVAFQARVSLDSMYPDADIIDNEAVRLQRPVRSLRSQSVPIQITYD
jgi:hypothetical protein